jgi:hypothetical protein
MAQPLTIKPGWTLPKLQREYAAAKSYLEFAVRNPSKVTHYGIGRAVEYSWRLGLAIQSHQQKAPAD